MSNCSIVIVTYHTGPILFACVKSALKQEHLAELIVVNNGNPPDTLARLQQMALTELRLSIITGHGNVGFSKGCNLGVKHATGDFIQLVNPDCLLPPAALTNMINALETFPGAMLAGGWLQNPDGSEEPACRRPLLTPKTGFLQIFGAPADPRPMPSETHEVPAISGAFMCIRKADYQKLFGLDEGYFLHVEDLDLCIRVHKFGGKILCVPSVQVTHMRSTSGETTSSVIEWHKARGFMRYFHKHFREKFPLGTLVFVNLAIILRFAIKSTILNIRASLRGKQLMHHTVASKRLMILASGYYELPETRELSGKTVLVTSATGQVGLCVIRRLLAAGASILGQTNHDPVPFHHERLRWLKGALSDAHTLEGYCVDAVVHCGQLWDLPPALTMLHEAEAKRVIAFGSTSVFAKALSRNWHEKEIVDRLNAAELAIAQTCGEKKMDWTILRPTIIYGVGLDLSITSVAKFIARIPYFMIYPPAFGRRQPVHADDLGMAVLQCIGSEKSYGKSYNLSGGEIVTFREIIERLFGLCRRKTKIVETTMMPFLLDIAGRILRKKHINGEMARRMNDDLVFFHDEAKKDFGFTPRPFLNGGMKDIEGF